jgi:hypothetical protein
MASTTSNNSNRIEISLPPDARKHMRVNSSLKVVIPFDNRCYMAKLHDISEGGFSITAYQGPLLVEGVELEIHVDGILSDESSRRPSRVERFNMRVVHLSSDHIGLEFVR